MEVIDGYRVRSEPLFLLGFLAPFGATVKTSPGRGLRPEL
jgi:hypothetical protein